MLRRHPSPMKHTIVYAFFFIPLRRAATDICMTLVNIDASALRKRKFSHRLSDFKLFFEPNIHPLLSQVAFSFYEPPWHFFASIPRYGCRTPRITHPNQILSNLLPFSSSLVLISACLTPHSWASPIVFALSVSFCKPTRQSLSV